MRLEQAPAPEEAEHAALDGALESVGVVGSQVRRLSEADGPVARLCEEAVEDDEVEVEVGIEGGAEAVQEGDGAQLGVRPGAGAGAAERGADGAEQDAEHGAGERGVAGQEGAQALRHGEHPLADGHWGQDVVGQVGGDLDHAAGVAGGTDAATLAGEGDQALGRAGVAADAGKTVRENAAAQVGAEVVLDPAGHALGAVPPFLAVLLALPGAARAQQSVCVPDPAAGTGVLEGAVRDSATSHPLQEAGVTVEWRDAAGGTVRRELETDRNGEFRICDVPVDAWAHVIASWFSARDEASNVRLEGGRARVVLTVTSPHVLVTGHVRENTSGAPVEGAAIRIGPEPEQLTDADGAFRVERLPPGMYDLAVERIGYATVRDSMTIDFGTKVDLSVRLAPDAVPLEAIRVEVRSLVLERTGFYTREERRAGTFITRDDIERRMPMASSDMLRRVPGLRLARDRTGNLIATGRGNCPYRFIINGVRINAGFSIDEMPPHWFEGMEVYQGPAQTPIEFGAGPGDPGASCGVIVIWTRNRR